MTDDRNTGLYQKYRVERLDGKDKGPYFVLDPEHDLYAAAALGAYAAVCEVEYPQLSADLQDWVARAFEKLENDEELWRKYAADPVMFQRLLDSIKERDE